MMVDGVDEEMTEDLEAIVVEEPDTIAEVQLNDMIAVEGTVTTEIGTIEAMVEIGMIEMEEDVDGIGLLQVATVGRHLPDMGVEAVPVPDRPEAAAVVEDTDPEVHREEIMTIAKGDDMMIIGTTVVVVGAQKTTGVGEVLKEGMVAHSILRNQVC